MHLVRASLATTLYRIFDPYRRNVVARLALARFPT